MESFFFFSNRWQLFCSEICEKHRAGFSWIFFFFSPSVSEMATAGEKWVYWSREFHFSTIVIFQSQLRFLKNIQCAFHIILWPFCHSVQWKDVKNPCVGGRVVAESLTITWAQNFGTKLVLNKGCSSWLHNCYCWLVCWVVLWLIVSIKCEEIHHWSSLFCPFSRKSQRYYIFNNSKKRKH